MVRVKFLQNVPAFSRNACVYLPDDQAKDAIKKGHAIKIDDPPTVDGFSPQAPMARVRFVVGWKEFAKGSRVFIPTPLAEKAIGAGAAERIDIPIVDDSMMDAPPADKAMNPKARGSLLATK